MHLFLVIIYQLDLSFLVRECHQICICDFQNSQHINLRNCFIEWYRSTRFFLFIRKTQRHQAMVKGMTFQGDILYFELEIFKTC